MEWSGKEWNRISNGIFLIGVERNGNGYAMGRDGTERKGIE